MMNSRPASGSARHVGSAPWRKRPAITRREPGDLYEDPMTDPILLTPGPLTTSTDTKSAMLSDWGSWDGAFNELTASVCRDLVAIVNAQRDHVCVPLQGSGTLDRKSTRLNSSH